MYGKTFASLWDGSLRGHPDDQLVFVYLIAHARADGSVEIIPDKIADDTGLPPDRVRAAISDLESPDPLSRTPDEDGRRLLPLDGRGWGWRVVNYKRYRMLASEDDRRRQNAESQQRFRDRQHPSASVSTRQHNKPKEKEKEKKREKEEEVASSTSLRSVESALPASPADQQEAVRSLIVGLAAGKDAKEAHKPSDPLAAVWEWCKANVATSERTAVMKFVGWLQKTGTTDPDILLALVKHYVVHRPANGFAYYAKTGQARAIIANRVRNDAEIIAHEQRKAEAAAFFGQTTRSTP